MLKYRLACCVPGCKRTTAHLMNPNHTEWLCDKHYKLVDKKLKRLRQKMKRRDKIIAKMTWKTGKVLLRWIRWVETDRRIWDRMKKQAIERAVGLG